MKRLSKILAFLRRPPLCFLVFVWVATLLFVAGAFVLIAAGFDGWPVYVVYGGSAVFFGYTVYTLVRGVPGVKAKIVAWAGRHPFADNLLGNYSFRTIVFSVLSFAVNIGFALFNGVSGIVYSSVWYGVLACYYVLLSALRGGILVGSYKAKKRSGDSAARFAMYKLKIYRLCGIALFVLELGLGAAVTLMILSDRPTEYTEIMAITSAAYTFYKVIFAVINVLKVRRLQDPMLQCFRNINLADAAVSLLSLQVTLVAVFSDGTDSSMRILNIVTGFCVCALTLVLGVVMIVRAGIKLKNFQGEILSDERREEQI